MCDIRELVQRVVNDAIDMALDDTPTNRRYLEQSIRDVVDTYNSTFDKQDELIDELSRQISELQDENDKYYKKIYQLSAHNDAERKDGEES